MQSEIARKGERVDPDEREERLNAPIAQRWHPSFFAVVHIQENII